MRPKKLRIDRKELYQIPEQWLEKCDVQGQTIYNELQESEFGHVRFSICFDRLLSLAYEV